MEFWSDAVWGAEGITPELQYSRTVMLNYWRL